jgi:hypothetical protein
MEARSPYRRAPLRAPIGPPPTARDALRRLESVRDLEQLVQWSHDLRTSGLLDESTGYTREVVRYWGRLCPGEVPPQGVSPDGSTVRLPSGETVRWVGDWRRGQWRLIEQLPEAA